MEKKEKKMQPNPKTQCEKEKKKKNATKPRNQCEKERKEEEEENRER